MIMATKFELVLDLPTWKEDHFQNQFSQTAVSVTLFIQGLLSVMTVIQFQNIVPSQLY